MNYINNINCNDTFVTSSIGLIVGNNNTINNLCFKIEGSENHILSLNSINIGTIIQGKNNIIDRDFCECVGDGNTIKGNNSIVNGDKCTIEGYAGIIKGNENNVNGDGCRVYGYGNNITGKKCILEGNYNDLDTSYSSIVGNNNMVGGDNCVIIGDYNIVNSNECYVFGSNNKIYGDKCKIKGNNNIIMGNMCSVLEGSNNITKKEYNITQFIEDYDDMKPKIYKNVFSIGKINERKRPKYSLSGYVKGKHMNMRWWSKGVFKITGYIPSEEMMKELCECDNNYMILDIFSKYTKENKFLHNSKIY